MDRDRGPGGEPTGGILGDPADDLVPQHQRFPQRERADRAVPVVVQVRAADAAVGVADQDLTGSGAGSARSSNRRSPAP